jgi:thioredoxin 2
LEKAVIVQCPSCGQRSKVPAVASGRPRCARCKTALPWIADASGSDFANVVEAASVPVVVDLWAPWCGPCRMISPALEEIARRRAGHLKIVKVNVDDHPDVSARFGVQGIPTLLLFDEGRLIDRAVGARGIDALENWIDAALAKKAGSRPA